MATIKTVKLETCIKEDRDKRALSKFKYKKGITHKKHGGGCLENDDCPNWSEERECPPDCPEKDACGNRQIVTGLTFDYLKPVTKKAKGIVLKTTKEIPKHTKVVEYCGKLRRMEEYQRDINSGLFKHSYGLEVVDNFVIDATTHSSIARYASHSCNPNCEIEFWVTDDGFPRAILVAKTKISAGRELTFNYSFESFKGHGEWECHCGKVMCMYKRDGRDNDEDNLAKQVKLYPCVICDKVFRKRANMVRHVRDIHERPVPQFECNTCGKCFTRKDRLTRHNKTHLDRKKPFWCSKCGKRFLTQQGKDRHAVVHDPNRTRKPCPKFGKGYRMCGKDFLSDLRLQKHEERYHA